VRYRVGGEDHLVAVTWGFAEVLPYKVTLLVNTAERAEDIDLQRAETARRRAQQRLEEFGVAYETDRARESAEKAQARLETAERAKKGKQ
jgi:F-type H+-transporting ATPase subunit epsilon